MYLLATDAFLEVLSGNDRVLTWLSKGQIGPDQWSVCSISIGQAWHTIFALPPSDPDKTTYDINLAGEMSALEARGAIRGVDLAVIHVWKTLLPLDLRWAHGSAVGDATKLVLACALANGLTLLAMKIEPWAAALEPRGLKVLCV